MKTEIRLICPSFGWTTVEINYKVNPAGSKTLYSLTEAWRTYRGQRGERVYVDALMRLNPYEEVEELIVQKTQGNHRAGLEADLANPRIVKKIAFKKTPKLPD